MAKMSAGWIVAIISLIALVGMATYWGMQSYALAVTPVTAIEYKGEFDNVKFLTTHENCFVEDVSSQAFTEDTDNDKWVGNATLTNFTDNSQIKVVPLYFEVDGKNGFERHKH